MATQAEIENWFSYHPPTADQVRSYSIIRAKAKEFAELIVEQCPPGDDRKSAIESLRETVRRANSSIACDDPSLKTG